MDGKSLLTEGKCQVLVGARMEISRDFVTSKCKKQQNDEKPVEV
jgi:hypothetical protein